MSASGLYGFRNFRQGIVGTTMLVAPFYVCGALLQPASALAACTASAGTVTAPANGATVTCPASPPDATTQIGNGGSYATVVFDDNAVLTSAGMGIWLTRLDLTMGANSRISTTGAGFGVWAFSGATGSTITMGNNAVIESGSGNALQLKSSVVTMGNNAQLNGDTGLYSKYSGNSVTMQSGAQVNGTNYGIVQGYYAGAGIDVTLNQGAAVTGASNIGIRGGVGTDTLDIAGSVTGGAAAIDLQDGNDFLTLRTGESLTGDVDGGLDTDTVTLSGSSTEDADFLNFEQLDMDGTLWTLSGTSAFGNADINSGTLLNAGTMTSDVAVHAGATFGGSGTTIGNVTNDGTVAPGTATATQTITGNYAQGAGGVLDIALDNASAGLLDISGTAALDGTVDLSGPASGVTDGASYTILQAGGGVSGALSLAGWNPLFIDPVLSLGANDVQLTLNRASFGTAAANSSERTVAQALDRALVAAPGSMATLDQLLNSQTSLQAASDILASSSGLIQSAAVSSAIQAMGQNAGVALGRIDQPEAANVSLQNIAPAAGGDNDPAASAMVAGHGTFWTQATGGFGRIDSDAKARGVSYNAAGLAVGAEKDMDEKLFDGDAKVGVFGAYSGSRSDAAAALRDSAETRVYQAGVYGGWEKGPWKAGATASLGLLRFESLRLTPLGTAKAGFGGKAGFADAKVSYVISKGRAKIAPFLGLSSSLLGHENYAEHGAGALNLSVRGDATARLKSDLGIGFSTALNFGKDDKAFTLKPGLSLSWAHEYLDQGSAVEGYFTLAPATVFKSPGPQRLRDSLHIKADLSAEPAAGKKFALYTSYEGDISADAEDHAFLAGLRALW